MKSSLIDWARLTDFEAADGDHWLPWRLARWARLAVARGAFIVERRDYLAQARVWEARSIARTPDEQARADAHFRMLEREARFDAENHDWARWTRRRPQEAIR